MTQGSRPPRILPKSGPALPSEDRLRAADAKLAGLKAAITKAALTCIRRDFDHVDQVEAALALVDAARADLARLWDDEVDEADPFA